MESLSIKAVRRDAWKKAKQKGLPKEEFGDALISIVKLDGDDDLYLKLEIMDKEGTLQNTFAREIGVNILPAEELKDFVKILRNSL